MASEEFLLRGPDEEEEWFEIPDEVAPEIEIPLEMPEEIPA